MPWLSVGADRRRQGTAQVVGEFVTGFQDDEQGHPVPPVGEFGADDQALADAGQFVPDGVDVGAAQPSPCRLRVESERPETMTLPCAVRVIQSPCHTGVVGALPAKPLTMSVPPLVEPAWTRGPTWSWTQW